MNQESIKVQKPLNDAFSKYFPGVSDLESVGMNEGQVRGHMYRDSSKISMLVSDGLEC